jgi:hypothetical protein
VLKSRDFSEIKISEKFTKITKSFGFGLGVGHAQMMNIIDDPTPWPKA